MASISTQKLAVIPYLDLANLNGRTITSMMFYDSGNWRLWANAGEQLVEIKGWPAESFFFANVQENPNDIAFHFLDFMSQRASFPSVVPALFGIRDDIFNLSASLAKIEHLHATRDVIGSGCSRMVLAEIEYIFLVCRSIFDLLQEIASKLWDSISLTDPSIKKKPLKKSFNDMVRFKGEPITREIMMERFGLPTILADYYVSWQDFFGLLRSFRDNVVHNGSQVQTVFSGEQGFLIIKRLRPFTDMNIWRPDERLPNDLVPLMPALGAIIHITLSACDNFSHAISTIIGFPPPIAPGMHLYMRGYFNKTFVRILEDAIRRLSTNPETNEELSKKN